MYKEAESKTATKKLKIIVQQNGNKLLWFSNYDVATKKKNQDFWRLMKWGNVHDRLMEKSRSQNLHISN